MVLRISQLQPICAKKYILSLPEVKRVILQKVGLIVDKDNIVLQQVLIELQPLDIKMVTLSIEM